MTESSPRPGSRLGFLRWYARADLYEETALPTTRAITLSVALATAGAVVALAIPWLVGEIRRGRQAADPLKSCLWVTDRSSRIAGRSMTPEKLETIFKAVRARVGDQFREITGFAEIEKDMVTAGGNAREYKTLIGRTITATDPLNQSLGKLLVAGRAFDPANPGGLLVTRQMLKNLGYSPEDIARIEQAANTDKPESVQWSSPSGQAIPLAVRGVFADPLPLGHEFIIPEAEDIRLRSGARFITDDVILFPLAKGWPVPPPGDSIGKYVDEGYDKETGDRKAPYHSRLPKSVVDHLGKLSWRIKLIKQGDTFAWNVIRLPDDVGKPVKLSDAEWRDRVDQLNRLMAEAGLGSATDFGVSPSDPVAAAPPVVLPEGHNWATVYVHDLFALRPVADVFRELRLECDESAIRQLEQIEKDVRVLRVILYVLVALFALSVAASVYHLGRLRARQKAAEIGMLRAMGISDRRLRAIAATEAGLLWADGTLKGLLMAILVLGGLLIVAGVSATELLATTGWGSHLLLQGGFLLATFVFCQVGTIRSVNQIGKLSPIEALNLSA
ncbi:FtsX-like permease family protein [Zavarzinella formosa]|uniref:FtsX-like permease family protein n=1 Tax=Zavarzinella formosa TaxID=360055 RepID=UPI0002F2D565|nr:ABC transporter permease [Zavarzinella formosa]